MSKFFEEIQSLFTNIKKKKTSLEGNKDELAIEEYNKLIDKNVPEKG